MKREDLTRIIAQNLGPGAKLYEAKEALNAVLSEIKNALSQGEAVTIRGFGTLKTVRKAERRGRNPATGEPHLIRKRRVVTFKASPYLKLVSKWTVW
jgi:nucleoid DNA-binding protein